jgi:Membrane bound beta barrel domain (DUF5777)
MRVTFKPLALLLTALLATTSASAQTAASGGQGTAQNTATPPAQADDPDRDLNLAQPDFTLATLPTTLRLPRFGSAFRVTHRFGRPLGAGEFSDLFEDFFGLDNGAVIGLEYRFGIFRGAQLGIHRTSQKTIQFFGQYDITNQRNGSWLGMAAYASIEGTNNFRDSYSPGLGLLVSRELGDYAAFYMEPFWVNNTNPSPDEIIEDDDSNDSFILGLGTRFRIRPTVYLLVEGAPRLGGHDPGVDHISFALEKRAGGHNFQLNFSNSFATTLADIARGGGSNDDWYIGFNISRKFYR